MSLLPLFLQVRAATPSPDAGSAPADASSSSTTDATTDVSGDATRDASATMDASTSADASSPPDAAATDAPRTDSGADAARPADASRASDGGIQVTIDPSFYVATGGCYTGRGFGNQTDDYHEGGCFQLTAGFPTLRFGENFYVRPEFRFQQEWVNHTIRPNHGGPVSSSASISDISGLVMVGWQPIPYFYAELGGLIGGSYFDSHAPENGEGGTFVSNLGLGVSLHNWGANYGAVLRLGFPEQRLMDGFALGFGVEGSVSHTDLSVIPDWSARNPNDPPVAVGSTSGSVGAFIRVRFGGPSGSAASSTSSGSTSTTSSSTGSSGSSSSTTAPSSGSTSTTGSSSGSSETSGSSGATGTATGSSTGSGTSTSSGSRGSSSTSSSTPSSTARTETTRRSGGTGHTRTPHRRVVAHH